MDKRKAQSTDSPGGASGEQGGGPTGLQPHIRVILVGRTGLDARLRLNPELELVRVRTALEAIGELADPLGEHTPPRSVVIVAADADPSRPDAPPWEGSAQEPVARIEEFMRALRMVEPGVRVLRADGGPEDQGVATAYDGVVDAEMPPAALRAAMLTGPTRTLSIQPSFDECAAAPGREEAPGSEGATERSPKPHSEDGGDGAVIRAALFGQDVAAAAVRTLGARLGDATISFEPASAAGASGAGGRTEGAPVAWRQRVFGVLRGAVGGDRLRAAADWLAAWLALAEQQNQLRDAALRDPLTGAFNRRFFDRFLESAIGRAQDQRQSVTVLVFDIDGFKQYNDRYGHAAGDEILKETVRLLSSVIRPSDRVCRIGGDEFAVVFYEPLGPRTLSSRPPDDVSKIAVRFQREVASQNFPKLGREAPGALTISGGLATYPWDGRTPAELLARADELALRSKREGKNAITIGPGARLETGGTGGVPDNRPDPEQATAAPGGDR